MLLKNIGRQGGFLWGLIFSAVSSISKGKTPSYIAITRGLSGMTLGFVLGVTLSAIRLSWCVWLGAGFLLFALIFTIIARSKKEVLVA